MVYLSTAEISLQQSRYNRSATKKTPWGLPCLDWEQDVMRFEIAFFKLFFVAPSVVQSIHHQVHKCTSQKCGNHLSAPSMFTSSLIVFTMIFAFVTSAGRQMVETVAQWFCGDRNSWWRRWRHDHWEDQVRQNDACKDPDPSIHQEFLQWKCILSHFKLRFPYQASGCWCTLHNSNVPVLWIIGEH